MGTWGTDSEQEGRTRRKTVNMEGFSIPTASIHEEWMDLADIVNNDLENDLEKKKLSDISGFDVVGLFNNNNNTSDKSFQRQQSYLDIFKDIEGEELMLGIDSVETSIFIDNASNNNISNNNDANAKVVASREEEGEHVEDLAVDCRAAEEPRNKPLRHHVGGRAGWQVQGDQLQRLCSALG